MKIVDIDTSYNNIVLLDSNGNVWAKNAYYGLGNYIGVNTNSMVSKFTCINNESNLYGIKIKEIATGYSNTYFIDEDNRIWACGSDSNKTWNPDRKSVV